MKKYFKLVYIVLIVITIFTVFNETYATTYTAGEIISDGDNFLDKGKVDETKSPIKKKNLKDLSDTIYNILLTIGIIAAFIVGGILGIKYMTSGIEGQAEVKNTLVPYLIGCVVLFGAFTIWKLVVTILQ